MTTAERELVVARIIAGCLRCNIKDNDGKERFLYIKSPSRYHRYVAQELYYDVLRDSKFQGLASERDVEKELLKRDLWTEEKQVRLNSLENDIEEFKIKLYQLAFKTTERKELKKTLTKYKEEFDSLSAEKRAYNWVSAEGAALLSRNRFLMAMSLYDSEGRPLLNQETYWAFPADILDQVLEFYSKLRLTEQVCRELVRNEPWRSVWTCKKSEGSVFGTPTADLTEEQKALIVWSSIYDSIYEHPECPPEDILDDDDITDGWLLIQKRKRKADVNKNRADSMVENERIKNSDEVFIVAETVQDAKLVDDLNDDVSKHIKSRREALLRKRGTVNEIDMPDVRARLISEINEKAKEKING